MISSQSGALVRMLARSMPLEPGTKLGPYEILSPIGAGGMGDVYRARDAKLRRDVAIKTLPVALAQDTDRLARFEQEARVLAALNHPNIAQIYAVESGALVMELVQGKTLSSPLPFDTALNYAKQIAEALEAAHEKGIIHCDLKPSNIMVTTEGAVKVLDFGLATTPIPETIGDPENSRTLTIAGRTGMIMGTAAYMSPEQAAGKLVDKRSDIWSFGVVLWEMLTGRRLFEGETISHILANVSGAPIDFDRLPPTVSPAIRTLLQRCLDRDGKARLRDIGEARILLSKPAAYSPSAKTQLHAGRAWLVWSLAALFAVSTAMFGLLSWRQQHPAARAITTALLPPNDAEFAMNAPFPIPAFSPDGTHIVYAAKTSAGASQLWLRRLDSSVAQPLTGTENAATPFWSPDSRWVASGQARKLKKIDIQGGPPLTIADIPAALRGGTWNSRGVILFGVFGPGDAPVPIMRVAASGGAAVPATNAESRAHRHPCFLPDGRHFLYTIVQPGDMPVHVGSLDEPEKPGKLVARAHSPAVYSQGYLLFLRDHTLMAQPFDPNRLETTGEQIPLAEGVPTYTTPSRIAGFAVSPAGLMVYASGTSQQYRLIWRDRRGKPLGILGGPQVGGVDTVEFSPDGKRLAVATFGPQAQLWILDTARGLPVRFTFGVSDDRSPVWSPDGQQIYFNSNRNDGNNLYRKAANGVGAEEQVFADSALKLPTSISSDGRLLFFSRPDAKTGWDICVLPLTSGSAGPKTDPQSFLRSPSDEFRARISPNGNWVAYQSNETAIGQVYVAPFAGSGPKLQVSSNGGTYPRWRADNKEIFYLSRNSEMMAAEISAHNTNVEVRREQKLFDGVFSPGAFGTPYDVSADGQRFLVIDASGSSVKVLTVVQNWTVLLRK